MINNIVSDSVLSKIKKLLALSGSSNQHEAELALMHAKRIAAENDVDMTLIQILGRSSEKEEIIKNEGISLGNRKSITQKYVSWILQDHFGVKIIYNGCRQLGMRMVLIGKKDKIAIAEHVQSFLNHEFLKLWRNYYATSGCDLTARDSYLAGLHRGLSEKLEQEQKNVESEKLDGLAADTRNSYALMVVSEGERLKNAIQKFYPTLKKATKTVFRGEFSEDAMRSGIVAGGKISLRPAIGQGAQSMQLMA